MNDKPIKQGIILDNDLDGGIKWFLFKSQDEAEVFIERYLYRESMGAGRYYASEGYIKRQTSKKVLVAQSWGYDC